MPHTLTLGKVRRRPQLNLHGVDGNAFNLLTVCEERLTRAGYTRQETETFRREATSGDYRYLLHTISTWLNVHFTSPKRPCSQCAATVDDDDLDVYGACADCAGS